MSFENFPDTGRVATPPTNSLHKKHNYLIAALIIVLLGTWAYIIWDKSRSKEAIQQKDTVISNTSSQRDQLQKELEDATRLYDMIKTSSSNMMHRNDSTISRKDREIADKKNKIQQLLSKVGATEEALNQVKGLLASLNGDINGYRIQIETLQGEKIELTQEKNAVIQQRDKIKKDFDSAQNMIVQKEQVIDVASTLHASNFNILGINERDGKEKETTIAKRVDKLRISFDIDENRVTQSGPKNIYISITAPNGKPLSEIAMGSGKIVTRDGEEKYFTQRIDVNYTQGQRQKVSLDWKQNSDFEIGDYKIEVYNNGFKIGEGIRSLKKGGFFS